MLDWLSFPAVLSHIAISGEWPLKDTDPTVGFLKGLESEDFAGWSWTSHETWCVGWCNFIVLDKTTCQKTWSLFSQRFFLKQGSLSVLCREKMHRAHNYALSLNVFWGSDSWGSNRQIRGVWVLLYVFVWCLNDFAQVPFKFLAELSQKNIFLFILLNPKLNPKPKA